MTMLKIAFIDHPFHQKTRSSNFFVKLLEEKFDVHTFYLDSDPRSIMQEIADSDYELVICWQTEFCAPYFLMRGKRVVCIPMYDGVEGAPDWYWLAMRQARFINFCEELHLRLKSLGIESTYAKYYGIPKADLPQAKFQSLRGFFWQRRPEDGLHYKFARAVLAGIKASLHVHNAPDTRLAEDWIPDSGASVTEFSHDGAGYRRALEESNIFISPRRTEGIGHPLIEAMARGMCVIAHDKPTANEYIVDGMNGILIDYDAPASYKKIASLVGDFNDNPLVLARISALGEAARASYLDGCQNWIKTSQYLPYFVETTPAPDLTSRDIRFAGAYLSISKHASRDFSRYLHKLLILQGRGLIGSEASGIRIREQITWRLKRLPGVRFVWRIARRVVRRLR